MDPLQGLPFVECWKDDGDRGRARHPESRQRSQRKTSEGPFAVAPPKRLKGKAFSAAAPALSDVGPPTPAGKSPNRRVKIAPKNPKDAPAPVAAAAPATPPQEEKAPKKERGPKGKDGKDGKEGGKDAKEGKKGKGGAPSASKAKPIPDNPNFRYIVRIAGADLDGRRPTGPRPHWRARRRSPRRRGRLPDGVGQSPPRCSATSRRRSSTGSRPCSPTLPERLPTWMLNHPVDYITGETRHLIGADLETSRRDDVNQMKMIRSYRGVRHERGQKVRGQRTRSNGRTGMAAGVLKKDAKAAAAAAKGAEKAAVPAAPRRPAAAQPRPRPRPPRREKKA